MKIETLQTKVRAISKLLNDVGLTPDASVMEVLDYQLGNGEIVPPDMEGLAALNDQDQVFVLFDWDRWSETDPWEIVGFKTSEDEAKAWVKESGKFRDCARKYVPVKEMK